MPATFYDPCDRRQPEFVADEFQMFFSRWIVYKVPGRSRLIPGGCLRLVRLDRLIQHAVFGVIQKLCWFFRF